MEYVPPVCHPMLTHNLGTRRRQGVCSRLFPRRAAKIPSRIIAPPSGTLAQISDHIWPFPPLAAGHGGLFWRSFCQAFWGFLRFLVTGFIFSMLPGLMGEKALLRPFAFKRFSGLGDCAVCGHKVAMQSVAGEASKMWHHPSLPAPRAGRRGEESSREFGRRPAHADHGQSLPGVKRREGRSPLVTSTFSAPGVLTCRPTVWLDRTRFSRSYYSISA